MWVRFDHQRNTYLFIQREIFCAWLPKVIYSAGNSLRFAQSNKSEPRFTKIKIIKVDFEITVTDLCGVVIEFKQF